MKLLKIENNSDPKELKEKFYFGLYSELLKYMFVNWMLYFKLWYFNIVYQMKRSLYNIHTHFRDDPVHNVLRILHHFPYFMNQESIY